MWLDKSCLQYFGSTAAPSILSFYPGLGVKRDVRSEPEIANYHAQKAAQGVVCLSLIHI